MWLTGRSYICRLKITGSNMTSSIQAHETATAYVPPAEVLTPHWYVVHTSANHERRVSEQFLQRGVEYFLPQYESVRRWKDRRMKLQLPLFPGYVFVRMALEHKLRVLQVPGVACLVSFAGKPAVVPADEFARIQELLNRKVLTTPHA